MDKSSSWKFIFIIAALVFFVFQSTKANGFGMTLDKPVGDYIVNVDYDAVTGIYAGDPVQFAFQLFDKDRSKQIEFGDVWVSVTLAAKGGMFAQPVFDGGIVGSSFPPSGMTFVFPASGSYTLNLRYEKNDKAIAEASFPLEVQAGSQSTGGTGGFFRITNDFLKGATAAMLVVVLFVVGRAVLGKREEKTS